MDLKLQDKTALVTGASVGIGRAIAIRMARMPPPLSRWSKTCRAPTKG